MPEAIRKTTLSRKNRALRVLWGVVYTVAYRTTPNLLHPWRCFLLRAFGATIGKGAHPYPKARIWAPWNLTLHADGCIANWVDCYNVAPVTIGAGATISQYSLICTASHDYEDPRFPLIAGPITIDEKAWVAAGAFLGPGVHVGRSAVVGARAVVMKDVPPFHVVAGNPARTVKVRAQHEDMIGREAR